MTSKNKDIPSAGILVLVLTIIGLALYYTYDGLIPLGALIPILAASIPFTIGLYTNASNPQKAQVLSSLWNLFVSLLKGKMSLAEVMRQAEIIMSTAANVWDAANQKALIEKEKAEIESLKRKIAELEKQQAEA